MNIDAQNFAVSWIDAWNSHNLDQILSHYSDDFEITTPMINTALGIDTGTLKGKAAIRQYWQAALEKVPDLHFTLLTVTTSVNSIAIYYESVFDKLAIEVMFINTDGKIHKAIAHYT